LVAVVFLFTDGKIRMANKDLKRILYSHFK